MSTDVGPRSRLRSQVETRRPRPTPPSRVNGCPWSCSGPKHLLAPSAAVRIGDPIRSLARPLSFRKQGSFRNAAHPRRERASAVSPTHEAQRVPPLLAMWSRAPFETRHPERRERLRFRNRPSTGGPAPPRRPLMFALLRILADPLLRDPHGLPRRARYRHPRHRRMTSGDGSSPASSPPIQILRSGAFPCRSRRSRSPSCLPRGSRKSSADDVSFTLGFPRP
jgi:hypothetical protein